MQSKPKFKRSCWSSSDAASHGNEDHLLELNYFLAEYLALSWTTKQWAHKLKQGHPIYLKDNLCTSNPKDLFVLIIQY